MDCRVGIGVVFCFGVRGALTTVLGDSHTLCSRSLIAVMVITFGWIYGTSAPNQAEGRLNLQPYAFVALANLIPCAAPYIRPVVKGVFIPDINRHNAKHGVELLGAVIMPVGRLEPSVYRKSSMSQNASH